MRAGIKKSSRSSARRKPGKPICIPRPSSSSGLIAYLVPRKGNEIMARNMRKKQNYQSKRRTRAGLRNLFGGKTVGIWFRRIRRLSRPSTENDTRDVRVNSQFRKNGKGRGYLATCKWFRVIFVNSHWKTVISKLTVKRTRLTIEIFPLYVRWKIFYCRLIKQARNKIV